MQFWVAWLDGSAAPSVILLPEIAHKPLSLFTSAYVPVNCDPSLQVATAVAIGVPIGELPGREDSSDWKLSRRVGADGVNAIST